MPGIYRPRHPERTVLYRVLFHHFDRFVAEYERLFEREYGYFRPVVREVVGRYLDIPGIIVAVQTFGDRINFHPHLHLLSSEGGVDRSGIFHRLPRWDDGRLAEIFGREVLALLVRMDYLEFIARVVSHIPDKGQVMVRSYGLYANARIHPSPGVDVRGRKAAARLCLRAGRPEAALMEAMRTARRPPRPVLMGTF